MSLRLFAIGSVTFLLFLGMVGVVRKPKHSLRLQAQTILLADEGEGEDPGAGGEEDSEEGEEGQEDDEDTGDEGDTTGGASSDSNAKLPQTWKGITLLQPLGGLKKITASSGMGSFLQYFNDAGGWLLDVVLGICVIWVLIGGFQVMLSGGFSGMDSAGKSHMVWAITGLSIVLFAGFILRLLNSMFFK